MIRQSVALLLAFAMLHLNVARVDATCTMHDHDAAASSHGGMQHDGGAPAEETSCETPASPDCCQALASCAPTLGNDEGSLTISASAILHMTIAAAVIERPLSRSTAPEPPPPKA